MTESRTPDVIVPRSTTFRLSHDEAAAALELAGVPADGRLLDSPGEVADPLLVLRAGGLVEGDQLPAFLREAIQVAACPARTIHAIASVPGSDEWVDVLVGAAHDGGPYVTVEATEQGVDLYAVETAMEIAAVFDDLFRLTSYPVRPVDPDISLTLPAWVGLLAMADVRRLRRLRNEMRRQPNTPAPMSALDLEGSMTVGVEATDSRWAVSAAVPIAPVPLRERRPPAEQAIHDLAVLRLIDGDASSFTPSELGEHMLALVEQTVLLGSITLGYRQPDREVRGGELIIYRTPTRLAIGIWTGTVESPLVTLTESTAESAVAMVRRMIELTPPPPPVSEPMTEPAGESGAHWAPPFEATHRVGPHASSVAPAAGTPVRVLARDGERVEVVAESGAHTWVAASDLVQNGSWHPTHRVGEGGAPTRRRPDPEEPVQVTLPEGERVEVIDEAGAWAHVRVERGEEVWIDGRRLISP